MFKIGLDLGYGYIKGVNQKGSKVLMPSLVARGVDRTIEKLFNSTDRYSERDLFISASAFVRTENGTKQEKVEGDFFIGELAQRKSTLSSYAFDYNKISHPNTLVLIGAVSALLSENNNDIHIATGPPLKYMKTQKDAFEEVLSSYKAKVKFSNGIEKNISFDKITIFPQGAAAIYSFFNENPELYKPGFMMIVEIGFKTTEILSFVIKKDDLLIEPLPEMSDTLEIGTSKVTKEVADEIYKLTELNIDMVQAEEFIQAGSFMYKGREYNINKIIEETRQRIATIIVDNIKTIADKKLELMNFICIAGGGARDFYPYIESLLPNVLTSKNPQFLNAYGYLKVAEMAEVGM